MEVYTPQHVQDVLKRLAPEIEVRFFEESTATSQLAAEQIGCELGQIVKSLLFIVDGTPVIVLASGDIQIDDRKLAALYDVGRKKVRIASAEQCIEITGYAPGGVPPVGHRRDDIPMYIDTALQRYETVYAAAGAHNSIFPIKLDRLMSITQARLADLKRE
jgi:prolyl-tRNA editing enzyme YbaK/EbsC (Cys-tRNA(Pro) deacylase)